MSKDFQVLTQNGGRPFQVGLLSIIPRSSSSHTLLLLCRRASSSSLRLLLDFVPPFFRLFSRFAVTTQRQYYLSFFSFLLSVFPFFSFFLPPHCTGYQGLRKGLRKCQELSRGDCTFSRPWNFDELLDPIAISFSETVNIIIFRPFKWQLIIDI